MNINEFYKYLNDFSLLNEKTLDDLKKLINLYPYFNILYVLYAKNIQKYNNYELNDIIPVASMYVLSRSHFYEIIKKEIMPSTTEVEELPASTQIAQEQQFSYNKTQVNNEDIHLNEKVTIGNNKSQIIFSNEKEINLPALVEQERNDIYYANITFYQNSTLTFKFSQKNYAINTSEIFCTTIKKSKENEIDKLIKKLDDFKITPGAENVEPVLYEYHDNEEFYTETMAEIYALQGNFDKAITIYEKLILKFPEKFNYFAEKINKLKQKNKP
ncbi:MAG: tetratricopeptide repeat protein [Bacteroidales bacterium]|nr:tetratricopeptide repeat protein [Bacteroidales bacterium]